MNLYELTSDYIELQILLAECEDGDQAKAAIIDTLGDVGTALADKIEKCAIVVKHLLAEAAAIKAEEQRLRERREQRERNADRLKAAMQDAMDQTGVPKVVGKLFTIYTQRNPPSLVVDDETALDDGRWWIAQDPRLDKRGIADAIKSGEKVPGCHLEQTVSLRIK